MKTDIDAPSDGPRHAQQPNWLARLVTGISALLLLALLGVIAWDAIHPDVPPAPKAHTGALRHVSARTQVRVAVLNDGDMAARDVLVRVTLATPDTSVEDDITIDWLPGRSRREVTVILPFLGKSPRVTAEVQGFVTP